MIAKGTAGSTSGGIKTMRVIIMVKGVGWWLKKITLPKGRLFHFVLERELSTEVIRTQNSGEVSLLLRMVPAGFNLDCVIREVASAQSNALALNWHHYSKSSCRRQDHAGAQSVDRTA